MYMGMLAKFDLPSSKHAMERMCTSAEIRERFKAAYVSAHMSTSAYDKLKLQKHRPGVQQ